MYAPSSFREDRVPILHDAIRRLAFASLVAAGPNGLTASHVPMLLDPAPTPFGTLRGHVARANPQWRAVAGGAAALAIFTGPNAYVSPSWYPSKAETGKVVPTWNYVAVQAHGILTWYDNQEWLLDLVTRLTEFHESARRSPWAVSDAPKDYVDMMITGIVGFELVIDGLEGSWKMSQNRAAGDRAGVVDGLKGEGAAQADAVAAIIESGELP